MSGSFFGQVQLPDWTQINTLLSPDAVALKHNQALASQYLPDQAQQQVQAGAQDLTDRATLRGLAPGLAARDPGTQAQAAVLPAAGGTNSLNALSAADTSRLNILGTLGKLPQIPGQPSPLASMLGGGAPIQAQPQQSAPQGQSAIPPGMAAAEGGGNPAAVNKQGYSGNFQFGSGRLSDLGMYQPAQGEDPNSNQWQGTISVPGFGQMTHAQFLANPEAQRMAAEVHFKDIGQQIDNTPGADMLNRTGLAAVAHLGGVAGMQKFVQTNGAYNPHDANGTSLLHYYDKFSQGGVPAMQASFGHPDGPLPADHPARQVASNVGAQGMPVTATDAGGGAPVGQQAPGGQAWQPTPPAGAKPITNGFGMPYTDGAPAGFAWAANPDGSRAPYSITPPQASRNMVPNPDGSKTLLDTRGAPLYTSQPNTRDVQIADYNRDAKSADDIAQAGQDAQANQVRLTHALDLAGQLTTGAGGGSRADWANLAQTYLPADLADKFSKSLVGEGGATAAQQFSKLMLQSAGQQERGVLGARGGYQATKLFMQANPGMELQPDANKRILNMQIVQQQADADYSNAALQHYNQNANAFRSGQGAYQPLAQFDQQWLSQRNPQIYSSAMAAAAGDPWQKWTQGLNMKSPDDVQRVVDIVRRAKPGSAVMWANGQPHTVATQ